VEKGAMGLSGATVGEMEAVVAPAVEERRRPHEK
jgi:hypothetical protein